MKEKKPIYGGQALIEGVMFTGQNTSVSAILRNNKTVDYFEAKRAEKETYKKIKKIPFLRGIVALLQSSAIGVKHLDFASDRFERDPKEDHKIAEEADKNTSKLTMYLGVGLVGVLSLLLGKVIFTLIPALIANFFTWLVPSHMGQVLLEGFFKLIFLLIYIYLISLTPLVKRLFQFHGAEHKVINAYENDLPLTVENVQKQSRLHYRCGSSFILFTVVVGVFVYLFVATDPLWWRLVNRILLLPIVIGISFEVLQFTNRVRHLPVLRLLGYPGLWLQLLTTKEPDDEQVLIALHSFKQTLENDGISVDYGDTEFLEATHE